MIVSCFTSGIMLLPTGDTRFPIPRSDCCSLFWRQPDEFHAASFVHPLFLFQIMKHGANIVAEDGRTLIADASNFLQDGIVNHRKQIRFLIEEETTASPSRSFGT